MTDDVVDSWLDRAVERRTLVYWLIVLLLPTLTFLEMVGVGGLWFSDSDDADYGVVEALAVTGGVLLACLIVIGGAEAAIRRWVIKVE